jgi:hypothetical protein
MFFKLSDNESSTIDWQCFLALTANILRKVEKLRKTFVGATVPGRPPFPV